MSACPRLFFSIIFVRTDEHTLGENIKGLLENFSVNMLREMAFNLHKTNKDLTGLNKSQLVDYLNDAFDKAQHKSKEFIYQKTIQNSTQEGRVEEHSNKPGSQEVNQ